jgi:hypothetical protein
VPGVLEATYRAGDDARRIVTMKDTEGRARKHELEEQEQQEGIITRHRGEVGGDSRGQRRRTTRAAAGDRAGFGGEDS